MKLTARQTTTATLSDLTRAMDRRQPVTMTYFKEEKDEAGRKTGNLVETVRTIEIYDIRTTKAGHITIKAIDRETGEPRTWRLDRIHAYTVHRTSYTVLVPAAATPITRQVPAATAEAIIYRELARDRDQAEDYDRTA